MVVNSLLHEFVDFLRDFLSRVKESLLFIVLPVERQIQYSDCLPEITKLGACSVDDPSDFVSHDEFEVLQFHVSEFKLTCAPSSSQMNNPSLILITPMISFSP